MPNILLTNYCNKKCIYCFAKNKLNSHIKKNISLKNYLKILEYFYKSNIRQIKLMGGEPTLHPDLKNILKINKDRKLESIILTNGLFSEKILKLFLKYNFYDLFLLINLNEMEFYDINEIFILKRNMQSLNKHIMLSFNIYQTNFDLSFLLESIKKYNLTRKIRLGLAAPIVFGDNKYFNVNSHKELIYNLIYWAKVMQKNNISLHFDCGFRLCWCNLNEYILLEKYSGGYVANCEPILDIDPDLKVWSCFPLSNILNVNLEDFSSFEEIKKFYENKFKIIRLLNKDTKCLNCNNFNSNLCNGGCIAYIMNENNPKKILQIL
jgi:radical SAM protein with 4Fe4S-binding SPASM domain